MQLARHKRKPATMGLTPLIDMIFLLLLFFLIGSDFVTYGQNRLAAPRGTGGHDAASRPEIISLAANGALHWNGAPVEPTDLAHHAARALRADAAQLFVVMPNAQANVQQVTNVMDALVGAGAGAITLERDVFDIDLADF